MWHFVVLIAVFATVFSHGVDAQEQPIDSVLRRLRPGQMVRVSMADTRRLEGRVQRLEIAPTTVRLEALESPLDASAIDSLWVQGRATMTGAIVGAVALGVPSFVVLAVLCEGLSEGTGCTDWGIVAGGGLAGAATGGLIGAAIGAAVPKWRRRFGREMPLRIGRTMDRGVAIAVSFTF